MIDLWPLIGVVIITFGLALRLNTLLVVLTSGLVTGLVANINLIEILSILGASFTQNRYMSLFILVLPMIGVLERFGLRERAEILIGSIQQASAGRVIFAYFVLRKVTNSLGLNLGGHPSMIRPLVAPMAEAAAEKNRKLLTNEERQNLRALAAMSENFSNFFSQLIFIGAGGLLLIKGVLEEHGYSVALNDMFMWAIPTALASCVVVYIRVRMEDSRLEKACKPEI